MASNGENYATGNPTENDLSLKEKSKRPLGKSVGGLEHQLQHELEESRAHCAELQKQNDMLHGKVAERDELEKKVKLLNQALEQRLAVQERLQGQVRKLNEALTQRLADQEQLQGHVRKLNEELRQRLADQEQLQGHVRKLNEELRIIKEKECKRTELQKEYSEQLVTLNKELIDKQSAYQQLYEELMKSRQQVETLYQQNIVFQSRFDMEIMRKDSKIRHLQGTLNFISQNNWIGDKISQGACGIVYQGTIPVAVKKPLHVSHENVQRFLKEKEIGYACHHPNLVQMFDVTDDPLIVMERLEGNLREFLNCYFHHMKATHIKHLALDIANGLNHLHRQRPPILHRDLKPENILLKKKGDFYIAKIGDYGTLRTHCDKMTPNRGTFIYAAPEGRTQDKQSTKMDIYSYGLVLKEICTGNPPDCQVSVQIDPRFKWLIDACVQPDPTRRPTITEVITSLNQLHV